MGASHSIQSSEDVISRWNLQPNDRLLFDCGRDEISQYLQAVDKIKQSAYKDEFAGIISMAMVRLKHEFWTVLTRQTESATGPSSITELSSSITNTTSYMFRYEDYVVNEPSKDVIDYLRNVVQRMNSFGHLGSCIQVYTSVRRHFVSTKMKRLRLEELQGGDKKRFLLEELKMKSERWIQIAKVCTEVLFAKEKQLAKQIFGNLESSLTYEECFRGSVEDAAFNLFAFAKAVSTSNQSSERLEVILILYEGLSSLKRDVNSLFAMESAKRIRDSAMEIGTRLQDEGRRMLLDFENGVLNEISAISDDDGKVNSLSEYVMEYISLIVKYRKLMNSIVSKPSMTIAGKRFPDGELQEPGNLSHLSLHLVLILTVLQLNLENKSKYFKDDSLGYLFMMNNVQYIVQKIEGSNELQEMIGAEYRKKLNDNVMQAMSNYRTLACDKFLDCLRDDGLYISRCFSSRVSKPDLRKKMKTFNGVFEEISLYQSSREVTDSRLRDELCRLILDKLLPAYECFLKKFRRHLDSDIGMEQQNCFRYKQKIHIKYSVDDLKALVLDNLFIHSQLCPESQVPRESLHLGDGHLEPVPEVQ